MLNEAFCIKFCEPLRPVCWEALSSGKLQYVLYLAYHLILHCYN